MSDRVYNGMIPLAADMLGAIAGPQFGAMVRNAPAGPKPFDETLPLTPRENMKLLLEHKTPRYLPMAGDTYALCPDIVMERSYDNLTGPDWFGALWTFEPGIGATMVVPGTEMLDSMENWRDKIRFPDLEALDWAESAAGMEKYYDPNQMSEWWLSIGLFERLHSLLGMENALLSLMTEEDEVAEFFEAMTDFKIRLIKKLGRHYKVDMINFHDDWGNKRNGFIPPALFDRLFLQNMKKIVAAVHDIGAYFNMHSDGKVDLYIPQMVEMGIDMWNPAESVNDLAGIKRTYGNRIVLSGAMDEMWTGESTAGEDALRAYARDKVDLLAPGGGFFASPAIFNMRNKVIMQDELKKYGRDFYNR